MAVKHLGEKVAAKSKRRLLRGKASDTNMCEHRHGNLNGSETRHEEPALALQSVETTASAEFGVGGLDAYMIRTNFLCPGLLQIEWTTKKNPRPN